MLESYSLTAGTAVLPDGPAHNLSLRIDGQRLTEIGRQSTRNLRLDPDLYLYPALINVHDHLRGTYLPRVGPAPGEYYLKCANWEKDLRRSAVVKERANISVGDCYLLGAYKNLLSGAATVNDHFPHEENTSYLSGLPVRAIENYTLAHETSSHALPWGDGIPIEHARAKAKDYPFIIHTEEGFDREYQSGIEMLEDLDALDEHDVLIHCLGFSEADIEKVRRLGSTVVWCPGSNFFMFNVTCKIRRILRAGINCALGTDSTHTGSVNLLEEMRFARQVYRRMYGEILDGKTLFDLVTINPARAFRMEREIGSIEAGKTADILVLRPRHEDPYEALVQAQIEDIELLTLEGSPLFGSVQYRDFFRLNGRTHTDVSIMGARKFVKGDPAGLLARVRESVGYAKKLDFIPLDEEG